MCEQEVKLSTWPLRCEAPLVLSAPADAPSGPRPAEWSSVDPSSTALLQKKEKEKELLENTVKERKGAGQSQP